MRQVIGIKSKKVYVEGETKADCLRKLHKQFPTFTVDKNHHHGKFQNKQIYPETLKIV